MSDVQAAIDDLRAALSWNHEQESLKTCKAIPAWVITKVEMALARLEKLRVDVRMHLACESAKNGQKAAADALGISAQYLGDVLSGRRDPGRKILAAMGLRKVVMYQAAEAAGCRDE